MARDKRIPPAKGSFIAYKKCYSKPKSWRHDCQEYIVTLEIPEDAKRVCACINSKYSWNTNSSYKCRASKAKVIAIEPCQDFKAPHNLKRVYSAHDSSFSYAVGQEIIPDRFSGDKESICDPGIHFYMTKEQAKLH